MLQFAAPAQLQAASLGLETFYSFTLNVGFNFEDPILRSFWLPAGIAICFLALATLLAGAVLWGREGIERIAPRVPKQVHLLLHRKHVTMCRYTYRL